MPHHPVVKRAPRGHSGLAETHHQWLGECAVEPESLAAIYDGFATTYVRNRDSFDLAAILDDFAATLPPTGELCDLGCGAGEPVSAYFADRGWRVTGVDFSAGMLELADEIVPSMTTVLGDIREVTFEAQSFDAVTAIYSLFHVPWHDHPAVFANVWRWLRPGGRMLFTYATSDYTGFDEFEGAKEFMGQELFYSHTTVQRLGTQLELAGFDSVATVDQTIGGETFLWVTANRPL